MSRTPNISHRKAKGVHYTPLPLGEFVARRIWAHLNSKQNKSLRVLDPSCGDGVLLEAFESAARQEGHASCEYVGVEAEEDALDLARARLGKIVGDRLQLIQGDFLEMAGPSHELSSLWESTRPTAELTESFDAVIANPPYVRTQVLGASKSRRLAEQFNLSGRVDLYHAFLVAVTASLRYGGVMGIIVSNRFLSTVTGASVRRYLARHFEACEVIDLGDTKLFEAAVLPAVFIGRRKKATAASISRERPRFMRVYSVGSAAAESNDSVLAGGIYNVLEQGKSGVYRVPEGVFRVSTGTMDFGLAAERVWSLTTTNETQWLGQIRERAAGYFEDIAQIRVGIKTTADAVFIRSDWEKLPAILRPEAPLLLPLLSPEDAQRWARKAGNCPSAFALYPHELRDGRRMAINLADFPRAKAYLESHQSRLRGRQYLAQSGRKWYEIWVPQDPGAWAGPKIVFPDISPEPRFFLDSSGSVVNGNCYWLTLRPGVGIELLYLLLGVANSKLMTRFHDLAFSNKLYAGRRRYITQYVGKYPYPDPSTRTAQALVDSVKELVKIAESGTDHNRLSHIQSSIESLVAKCYGLTSNGEGQPK